MSTREQQIDAFAIRQLERRRSGPENQWVTMRMFAGIIASTLVLPAFVPFFEAFRLRSPALFLVGLFFLVGFGVSYYVSLRCFLEADVASETETEQPLPTKTVDETLVVPQMALSRPEDRGATTIRSSWKRVRHLARHSA